MSLQHQIALTLLTGGGKKKIRKILTHFEDSTDFFKASKHRLKTIPGIGEKFLQQLDRESALREAEKYEVFMDKHRIKTMFYTDAIFPYRLNQCEDAPILMYTLGKMDCNMPRVVSIVGTRNASSYGRKICEDLLHSFVGKDIVVVSGLAYGIDIYAHKLCTELGIQTIGVLGHGLDRIYPQAHIPIAQKMLENGGLLTEFLPGSKPDRENFPMRNRIVAGMCDATIVIESGERGGSLITAELANDYARDVFAFPGDITREYSKGCNYLIQKNKAHLITSSDDFFEMMDWKDTTKTENKQLQLFAELDEQEQKIVTLLKDSQEVSLDVLAIKTEIPVRLMSGILLGLELKGVVKALPGKRFGL
jgi:DNA processing protein